MCYIHETVADKETLLTHNNNNTVNKIIPKTKQYRKQNSTLNKIVPSIEQLIS